MRTGLTKLTPLLPLRKEIAARDPNHSVSATNTTTIHLVSSNTISLLCLVCAVCPQMSFGTQVLQGPDLLLSN